MTDLSKTLMTAWKYFSVSAHEMHLRSLKAYLFAVMLLKL